ncbi:radical SAM family heme chaperone HemW [uncultured Muribaculum sp.]|uniref:radical SAM family heme chaperone HemW n=1 Tax=uncultured Muribaculum sp. TaxID=1918613 RepID=UPI0025DE644D|nr:radical SAM family heme chaperone HemW [uncultured Muribaculum sp.]
MSGIYIHIPFCHSKCAYCDFFSIPEKKSREGFADAVSKEWDMRRHELSDSEITTIYVGGGTPSILTPGELEAIVSPIPKSSLSEFTVEANPEDVTAHWVSSMRSLGVDRISIGVQSLNDRELAAVGRRHTAAEALDAIETILRGGISNISADLIYGLPGQTIDTWRDSLERLLQRGITHLSAYALSYEQGTRLYAMLMTGKIKEIPQEVSEQMYDMLCKYTTRRGFTHYEISNFALPGKHSRHNSSYWDYTPYLGLGPGAHSFDGEMRRVNPPGVAAYIAAINSGKTFYTVEEETTTDRINDLIITSLRTSHGLNQEAVEKIGGSKSLSELRKNADPFISSGRLLCTDSTMRIPEKYWLISDAILRDLLLE